MDMTGESPPVKGSKGLASDPIVEIDLISANGMASSRDLALPAGYGSLPWQSNTNFDFSIKVSA